MKTSESQAALVPALFAAWQAFPAIAKTKEGQAGNRKFQYAPYDQVLDAVRPVLIANGLLLTQGTDGHNLITRIDHISGEWREISMPHECRAREHAELRH
jgi:predicted RNase H-like nuclease